MPHFQVQRLGANSQFRCSHSPNMRFFHRSSLKYRQPMTVEVPFPEHATQKHDAHFRQIQFYKSKKTCKYWYKLIPSIPFLKMKCSPYVPLLSRWVSCRPWRKGWEAEQLSVFRSVLRVSDLAISISWEPWTKYPGWLVVKGSYTRMIVVVFNGENGDISWGYFMKTIFQGGHNWTYHFMGYNPRMWYGFVLVSQSKTFVEIKQPLYGNVMGIF
jgi:hypothetical protein